MAKFELERLTDYSDENLLAEVRRVANLIQGDKVTIAEFDRLGKVHSSTLRHRFGSWRKVLLKADLENKYDDVSDSYSRDEIIKTMKSVATKLGKNGVTMNELRKFSGITSRPIRRIFGSYRAALKAAGMSQNEGGIRYTDEECFENLLTMWITLGHQPHYSEIKVPPSKVGPKAYITRWGSWRKALIAFIERVNSDIPSKVPTPVINEENKTSPSKRTSREIPLGLRYDILKRDRFRCKSCGRSPSTHPDVVLHVDHIKPWASGGETVPDNLEAKCQDCNWGKGKKFETT